MHFTKIQDNISVDTIIDEISMFPSFDAQICIQGVKENDDPLFGIGVGGGKNSWERKQNHNYKSTDFKYTLFHHCDYLNELIKKYNMTYTRLMKLKSKTCLSHHKDKTKRLHIPLVTNEHCWLVVDKKIYHAEADGSYYIVDTTKMHTAINASYEDRLHIVGNVQ